MFTPDQIRNLKLRVELDKIEAESEQQHAEDGTYKSQFSEGARQDLEGFAKYLSQPLAVILEDQKKNEVSRMHELKEELEHYAASNPAFITCGMIENHTVEEAKKSYQLCIKTTDGALLRVCTVVSDQFWFSSIEDLEQKPESKDYQLAMDTLIESSAQPVRSSMITTTDSEFGRESVSALFGIWLDNHFPKLSELPVVWIPESENAEFAKEYMKQTLLKKFIRKPQILEDLANRLMQKTED